MYKIIWLWLKLELRKSKRDFRHLTLFQDVASSCICTLSGRGWGDGLLQACHAFNEASCCLYNARELIGSLTYSFVWHPMRRIYFPQITWCPRKIWITPGITDKFGFHFYLKMLTEKEALIAPSIILSSSQKRIAYLFNNKGNRNSWPPSISSLNIEFKSEFRDKSANFHLQLEQYI